jgi:hypothetical protein
LLHVTDRDPKAEPLIGPKQSLAATESIHLPGLLQATKRSTLTTWASVTIVTPSSAYEWKLTA